MSLVIMFYFTSMLNMLRTLTHPSSGAATFLLNHPIGRVFVSVWLGWGCIRVAACWRKLHFVRLRISRLNILDESDRVQGGKKGGGGGLN